MKKLSLLISSLFLSLMLLANTAFAAEPEVFNVSSARELVNAIGPNRIINLAPTTYNLTEAAGITNKYISWENTFDGPQLNITGVSGLTINGDTNAKDSHLVVSPAYADVIHFSNCENITLSGLKLGHLKTGGCEGSVLCFNACQKINLLDCDLYGCGVIGLEVIGCKDVKVVRSIIHDCAQSLMLLKFSNNVLFDNVTFSHRSEAWGTAISLNGVITNATFRNTKFIGFPRQALFRGYQITLRNFQIKDSRLIELRPNLSVKSDEPFSFSAPKNSDGLGLINLGFNKQAYAGW